MIKKLIFFTLILGIVLVFSQFPIYLRGYTSRLDAHIMELELVLSHYDQISESMHISMDQMLHELESADSPVQRMHAAAIQRLIHRHKNFLEAQAGLLDSAWWFTPFVLTWHFDSSLGWGAWKYYRFSIAFTEESLRYGLLGLIAALILLFIGSRIIQSVKR